MVSTRTRGVCRLVAAVALTVAMLASGCSRNSLGSLPSGPVTTGTVPPVKTYATTFPLTEGSISEAGRWMGGKTIGLDWGDVSTEPGFAIGHAGPQRFADSVALLTGHWGANQTVEAVVDQRRRVRAPEVSLRLRSSMSAHRCTGYEVSNSVRQDGDAYLIIVRWNGPLADFTYLLNVQGKQYGVKSGDVVKATMVGDTITAYKNGIVMGHAKDGTFRSGQPGFGFNEGQNGVYGIARFTVAASDGAQ